MGILAEVKTIETPILEDLKPEKGAQRLDVQQGRLFKRRKRRHGHAADGQRLRADHTGRSREGGGALSAAARQDAGLP